MADDTNPRPAPPTGTDVRTFLIADVRGYTRFTQEQGDAAASELATRFAGIVQSTVTDLAGDLVEVRGDEALCVFGSARQAIRAAVELQRRLRTSDGGQPAFSLGVGIGVDAGEAVPTDGGYRGAALNVASRLCSAAGPGKILASETVTQLARQVDDARYLPARVMRLKGIDGGVRVVEIEAKRPLPPVPPAPPPQRRRRWVIPVGVSAVVLILALGIAVHRAGSPGSGIPIRTGSVVAIDAATGTIEDDFALPVGSAPAPLVTGGGVLWTYNANRKTIIRIDPRHRHADERGLGVAPTDIAAGAGYEWIADGVDNKLFQLQWESGTDALPVRLPPSTWTQNLAGLRPSESGQVTVLGHVVWATSQGTEWPQTVVAIRTSDLHPLHTYHVSEITRQIGDLESGPAGVWMENRVGGGNSGKAALVALTPSLGRPRYVSQGNYLQQGVAVSRTSVWFAGGITRTVAELDPTQNSWLPVVTPYPITAIAAGPAGVWAASSDPGIVYQFNPATQRIVHTVKVGRYVTGIAVGDHRVWVLVQSTQVAA